MKYIRKFNEDFNFSHDDLNHHDIKLICKKYGIRNYTINDDYTIDVIGNVDLYDKRLTELPLKFRKVIGIFDCSKNQLVSLKGSPEIVLGMFRCDNNNLVDLQDGPKEVINTYDCSNNNLLSLEGAPLQVHGDFNCSNNKLESLQGLEHLDLTNIRNDNSFICSHNKLTTLQGAPKAVGGSFICTDNKLNSLEFISNCRRLICNDNPIYKWWSKVDDITKLDAFIDLGIDSHDADFMNAEKIELLLEE